ncbi:MarR family winged helix-turn-helix transcriptional regulator [Aquihabitans sp. McL0605]|uniref:MarR family winged helix-turn-helix transcriptional regulator n=1 Tax=Aquihabitans sp. McL0605 TaxID=3415671 RepID=UPI003CF6B80F
MTTTATEPSLAAQELAAGLRLSVTRLARILRQQADASLSPTQLAALATITRSGPLPIGTLADEEQIGAPAATKIVDKLQASGYVVRESDPADRRVSRVSTTPAGEALMAEIRARKTAWLTNRLEALPPHELATLTDALVVLEHLTTPPKSFPPQPQPPESQS